MPKSLSTIIADQNFQDNNDTILDVYDIRHVLTRTHKAR